MSRLRFRTIFGVVATASSLAALPAFADEPNVCVESYEQAQVSMKPRTGAGESTLLRARTSLLTCMRSNCKDWMVADCSKWLTDVEARIPTVVFSARNTARRDLAAVKVQTASGEALTARLDGRAIELEPGEHVFVFIAGDGTRIEKTALVREGEKSQSIVAMFEASPEEVAKARAQEGPTGPTGPTDRAQTGSKSTLRYVGYGATALGVVGLGVGAIFGITAIAKKNAANCDASGACEDGEALASARSAAVPATVGFVVGGALLIGGVALILFAPSSSVRIEARSSVSPSGSFTGVGGTF